MEKDRTDRMPGAEGSAPVPGRASRAEGVAMNRVRTVLAVGLLAGGSGCAAFQRPPAVQAPQGPSAIAEASSGLIDPFHPPVEPPSARIARYFPGLSRPAPSIESMRNGGPS